MGRSIAREFRPASRGAARTSAGWISASRGRGVSPVALTPGAYNRLLPQPQRTASGRPDTKGTPCPGFPHDDAGVAREPARRRARLIPPGIRSDALPWPEAQRDVAGRPGAPQPEGGAPGGIPDTRYSAAADDNLLDPRGIALPPRRPGPGHSRPPRRTLRPDAPSVRCRAARCGVAPSDPSPESIIYDSESEYHNFGWIRGRRAA